MYVYVLDNEGKPLMPTRRLGKVRHLLKNGEARVAKRTPFTIQLLRKSKHFTQPLSLGIDAGSKTIGLSVTDKDKEVYASYVSLRTDVSELIATRREFRNARRNRTKRYRKAKYDNRIKRKKKWLAPSVEQKISTHLRIIADINKILPISNTIVETASFDMQLIKNNKNRTFNYQQGEQFGFWNVREYVLWRDGHVCQHCKGKSQDSILNVHHIESRKFGGNAPNNLITLCKTCHKKYHKGEISLDVKRGKSYKDSAFMGQMRRVFFESLKTLYKNVSMTFGYITKSTRIANNLKKDHYIDARCISGNPTATPLNYYYLQKATRKT